MLNSRNSLKHRILVKSKNKFSLFNREVKLKKGCMDIRNGKHKTRTLNKGFGCCFFFNFFVIDKNKYNLNSYYCMDLHKDS